MICWSINLRHSTSYSIAAGYRDRLYRTAIPRGPVQASQQEWPKSGSKTIPDDAGLYVSPSLAHPFTRLMPVSSIAFSRSAYSSLLSLEATNGSTGSDPASEAPCSDWRCFWFTFLPTRYIHLFSAARSLLNVVSLPLQYIVDSYVTYAAR